MATHKPPVVPEIAKAYENDPRTVLALAAMKQGQSTAPVALGNYGYADGIARVLQGLAAGHINNTQEDKYTHGDFKGNIDSLPVGSPEWIAAQNQRGEDGVLALRHQRGVDGMSGLPGQAAPQAVAAASALGAPPVAPPTAPVAPPTAPVAAPVQGGGPMGRAPFASGGRSPVPDPTQPIRLPPEAVPAAPAPMARPVAPEPVGPTRSRMLDAAYRIMSDANPYESAQGQDMYTSGLSDQTKLDENAAERRQRLADMGYSSDLGQYANASSQDRAAAYSDRSAAQTRNFTRDERYGDQSFKAGESALERKKDLTIEGMRERSAAAIEHMKTDDALIDPLTLREMAKQAWAGDTSVFSGLGRGQNGARNMAALRRATYDYGRENNKTGTDLAAMDAQFFGQKRAASAAGQRVGAANVSVAELPRLTALSSEAYQRLPRGQFVPFNKLERLVKTNTSSPEQAKAYAADFAVINAYARALSPTGQPHQADKQKAMDMLNGAYSQEAHEAVLSQIELETAAIKAGASEALGSPAIRDGGGSGGVAPRKPGETPAQYLKRTGG